MTVDDNLSEALNTTPVPPRPPAERIGHRARVLRRRRRGWQATGLAGLAAAAVITVTAVVPAVSSDDSPNLPAASDSSGPAEGETGEILTIHPDEVSGPAEVEALRERLREQGIVAVEPSADCPRLEGTADLFSVIEKPTVSTGRDTEAFTFDLAQFPDGVTMAVAVPDHPGSIQSPPGPASLWFTGIQVEPSDSPPTCVPVSQLMEWSSTQWTPDEPPAVLDPEHSVPVSNDEIRGGEPALEALRERLRGYGIAAVAPSRDCPELPSFDGAESAAVSGAVVFNDGDPDTSFTIDLTKVPDGHTLVLKLATRGSITGEPSEFDDDGAGISWGGIRLAPGEPMPTCVQIPVTTIG